MVPHPLRVAREQRGWSQAKVAELLGVSTRTVSRWEKNESIPYPFYRERLCSLFDKSASELGLLEPDHPPPIAISSLPPISSTINHQQTDIPSNKIENSSETQNTMRRNKRFRQPLLWISLSVLPLAIISALYFLLLQPAISNAALIRTIAINAGGGQVGSFMAGAKFTTDVHQCQSTDHPIDTSGVHDPAPQAIYQSNHCSPQFTYSFSHLVPHATYTVRLHFAETYWTRPGIRVFNVSINNQQVLTSFDIVAVTGGPYRALVRQFQTTTTGDGTISITFTAIKDNALVSGIELSINA